MKEPSFNVEDFMNYESPIKLIVDEISTSVANQTENHIMSAVRNIGIDVDKEELVKALNYDRESYVKGFNQGYAKGHERGFIDALDEIIEDCRAKSWVNKEK